MLTRSLKPIAFRVLGHSPIPRAPFSVAAIRYKKAASKPVRRTASGAIYNEKSFLSEDSFPPPSFLRSAKLSGALNLLPDEAINLLQRYITLAKSLKNNWEKEVCTDPKTSPETLTLLGHILIRSPGTNQKNLGNHVLRTASKLGCAKATIDIVSTALRQEMLQNTQVAGPLQQLERLAQSGKNAKAMVLQGKLYERKTMVDSALKLYEKASNLVHEHHTFADNVEGISEAFVAKGRIFLQRKDNVNAEKAFKSAALALDDPTAYYLLGRMQELGSSTQEVYLMKAAASGVLEACNDLGALYLERSRSEDGKKESLQNAREWLEIAAAEGYGESMLFMAEVCWKEGRKDRAEEWLGRVKGVSDADKFVDRVRKLRTSWASI